MERVARALPLCLPVVENKIAIDVACALQCYTFLLTSQITS